MKLESKIVAIKKLQADAVRELDRRVLAPEVALL